MVAPKRGRGAKAQAAKAKAETNVEPDSQESTEISETVENPPEDTNNGESEQQEHTEESAPEGTEEPHADGENQEENQPGDQKEDEKKEPESGKLLVENLPSNYLFDYQEKLKDLFSKHGEVVNVKRGPIIVTELTTTPTLSAIVEFKNKECMQKALAEDGAIIEGNKIAVSVEMRADSSILVGVPHEASIEYVRLLFSECGEINAVQEYNKSKYKTLRVTFANRDSVEKAVKLDRELRVNGFLVTVTRFRDDDDHRAQQNAKNKRQHPATARANAPAAGAGASTGAGAAGSTQTTPRTNNYRGRGGFAARANFRGGRGRGFAARGGAFPRGGYAAAMNSYMPPAPYMARPVWMSKS
ncbi:hypothetical protein EVAR_17817_1 [Eumeta japonica]|uniref:RRM domain-containing protein n=1 Tax=Eumeta variegata TaxID=151549 RepID=A0A4C1TTI6_EUMVA|nr:hypothetical protein EVAR_17817_1 [Eumeta japonica]